MRVSGEDRGGCYRAGETDLVPRFEMSRAREKLPEEVRGWRVACEARDGPRGSEARRGRSRDAGVSAGKKELTRGARVSAGQRLSGRRGTGEKGRRQAGPAWQRDGSHVGRGSDGIAGLMARAR